MITSNSPWIKQLKLNRAVVSLSDDRQTHVAVVGAGISGVSTAYFILTETAHDVVLIEAGRAAHGATGHNAGQVVSYFEQQVSELA